MSIVKKIMVSTITCLNDDKIMINYGGNQENYVPRDFFFFCFEVKSRDLIQTALFNNP